MHYILNRSGDKQMLWVKRGVLVVLVTVFYFLAFRRLRVLINTHWTYPTALSLAKKQTDIVIKHKNLVSIQILFPKKIITPHKFNYKIAFGGYLLLSVIFISGLGLEARWILWLLVVHSIIFIFETGMLLGGLSYCRYLLDGVELLNRYLSPAFSFGIVALAWYMKKDDVTIKM